MKRYGRLAILVMAAWTCAGAPVQAQGQDGAGAASVWAGKKSSWLALQGGQRDEVFRFAEQYKQYLAVARSPYTATSEAIRLARAAGFAELTRPEQVKPGARLILPARDRAVVLAVIGQQPLVSGSHVVGTHHDSPHIALKARPVNGAARDGLAVFNTVYYGGIKKYQWANVPLALTGRIDTTGGRTIAVSIGFDAADPVFAIGDAAPHADKELRNRSYTEVFKGEELDPVAGSIPGEKASVCLLYTSPSPRDRTRSRMPSSA